jgi:hypothetical protein
MAQAKQIAATIITVPAGSDLSAKQFHFMDVTSGTLATAGAGTRVAGVLCNDPDAANEAGALQIAGVAVVLAGGSISAGGGVASSAAGKAVAASGSAFVCGIALTAADDGDYVGVLLTGSSAVGLAADVETVTSGALNVGVPTSYLSVTGAQAYTLADGAYVGQRKRIECSVAASIPVGTLTINDAATGEPTTWVFNAVGQMIDVMWTSTGWKLMAFRAAGVDTPAAASTLNLLVLQHTIAISGTQDWVLPDGEVPGQMQIFKVASAASIPVGTISGLFYDEDGSADGVDINFDAAADMATVVWDGARWNPIQLVSATVS